MIEEGQKQGLAASPPQGRRLGRRVPRQPHRLINRSPDSPDQIADVFHQDPMTRPSNFLMALSP